MVDENTLIKSWLDDRAWFIRRYSSDDFNASQSRNACMHSIIDFAFPLLLRQWNEHFGTRSRKPVEPFLAEAARRGYACLEYAVSPEESDWYWEFSKGDFKFRYCRENGKRKLKPVYGSDITTARSVTMEAYRMFDFMDYFSIFLERAYKAWNDEIFKIRQDASIGRISRPFIEAQLRECFIPKRIKYLLKEHPGGLDIYINLVKEIWFTGPVTVETLDHIVSMTPYARICPRDFSVLGPDFRIYHDNSMEIENEWCRLQVSDADSR